MQMAKFIDGGERYPEEKGVVTVLEFAEEVIAGGHHLKVKECRELDFLTERERCVGSARN